MHFVFSFIGSAIALFLTAYFVAGVSFSDTSALLVATIVVGLVNTFIRPILRLISLPITMVTFGLFALVVNAATFALAAWIVPGFEISSIVAALVGALILSVASTAINFLTDKIGKSSKNDNSSKHDSD